MKFKYMILMTGLLIGVPFLKAAEQNSVQALKQKIFDDAKKYYLKKIEGRPEALKILQIMKQDPTKFETNAFNPDAKDFNFAQLIYHNLISEKYGKLAAWDALYTIAFLQDVDAFMTIKGDLDKLGNEAAVLLNNGEPINSPKFIFALMNPKVPGSYGFNSNPEIISLLVKSGLDINKPFVEFGNKYLLTRLGIKLSEAVTSELKYNKQKEKLKEEAAKNRVGYYKNLFKKVLEFSSQEQIKEALDDTNILPQIKETMIKNKSFEQPKQPVKPVVYKKFANSFDEDAFNILNKYSGDILDKNELVETVMAGRPDDAKSYIKKAFNKASLKWHPDKFPSPADKPQATIIFKQINDAREQLLKAIELGRLVFKK